MEACHWIRSKTHRHKVCQFHWCLPRLQHLFKNLIILWETSHYPTTISPASFGQIVIVSVFTFFATELLISSPIPYPVSAFKAYRHLFFFFFVFHFLSWLTSRNIPQRQISAWNYLQAIGLVSFFSFLRKVFLFFKYLRMAEKIFIRVNFILKPSKKAIWLKKRKT